MLHWTTKQQNKLGLNCAKLWTLHITIFGGFRTLILISELFIYPRSLANQILTNFAFWNFKIGPTVPKLASVYDPVTLSMTRCYFLIILVSKHIDMTGYACYTLLLLSFFCNCHFQWKNRRKHDKFLTQNICLAVTKSVCIYVYNLLRKW